MARVQRANVILQVADHEVARYMSMGYNLIDSGGAVLKEAVPNNLGVLRAAYLEHTARIKELEAQLAESDSIICQLKDELDAATANAETSEAAANAGTTEETPKKAGRTTKKSE